MDMQRITRMILATAICLLALVTHGHPQNATRVYRQLDPEARMLIQEALTWTGHYDEEIDGRIGSQTIRAIRRFQEEIGGQATGILTNDEARELIARAQAEREAVGYAAYDDPQTGFRIGIPLKLTPHTGEGDRGSRFASPDGHIEIELVRFQPSDGSLRELYQRLRAGQPSRRIRSARRGDGWFLVSGSENGRRFYTRAREDEFGVAAFGVIYDESVAETIEPIIEVMESGFAHPDVLAATLPAAEAEEAGVGPPPEEVSPSAEEPPLQPLPEGDEAAAQPAPEEVSEAAAAQEPVPIAAGFPVSAEGHFLTAAQIATCQAITIGSLGTAELIASDPNNGLALLKASPSEAIQPAAFALGSIQVGHYVTVASPVAGPDAPVTISTGEVIGISGPDADTRHLQVAIPPRIDDGGAPLINSQGFVTGILMPMTADAVTEAALNPQQTARIALRKEIALLFLSAHGFEPTTTEAEASDLAQVELSERARSLTQSIFCGEPAAAVSRQEPQ